LGQGAIDLRQPIFILGDEMKKTSNVIEAGVIGASGYTGAELVRILARHTGAKLRELVAQFLQHEAPVEKKLVKA